MIDRNSFESPDLWLEKHSKKILVGEQPEHAPKIPDKLWMSCPGCRKTMTKEMVSNNTEVCPYCDNHFVLSARKRLELITDENSFTEMFSETETVDILNFPEYGQKLEEARAKSGENESVVCGSATVDGYPCMIAVMEAGFMMGSMGRVTGERICRTFETALERHLPVLVFTASGGARMQEGAFSLMQMAKTSGAVKRHSQAGLFYLTVITHPTTGGVTASFAMLGDVIIAEPSALIGFAGPRVIEQTIRQKLPEGFQRAEFVKEKGFLDDIVPRKSLKAYIARMLKFHALPATATDFSPDFDSKDMSR